MVLGIRGQVSELELELRTHPIAWKEPNYRMLLRTLHHPIYAGVYAFGRMTTVRQIDHEDGGRLRVRTFEEVFGEPLTVSRKRRRV